MFVLYTYPVTFRRIEYPSTVQWYVCAICCHFERLWNISCHEEALVILHYCIHPAHWKHTNIKYVKYSLQVFLILFLTVDKNPSTFVPVVFTLGSHTGYVELKSKMWKKRDRPSDFQFQPCDQRSLLEGHCSFYIYACTTGQIGLGRICQRWCFNRIIDQAKLKLAHTYPTH